MDNVEDETSETTNVTILHNQPYDESIEAETSDDKDETKNDGDAVIESLKQSLDLSSVKVPRPPSRPAPSARVGALGKGESDLSQNSQDDDEDEDEDEDDDDDDPGIQVEGAYDPADYDHLSVSGELKELFQYITRYTPQTIELEHKLKPFIPDFIPAVGDIDAFIKIPPPDNKPDKLGLHVLDEPCAKQSDPTVLDLQLRAISKETTVKTTIVKSLQDADKHPKEIDSWITSIGNLHRSKPPPTVHYARNMPDIDTLMQEWPPEFEELLKEVGLPSADLDCTLEEYVKIITGVKLNPDPMSHTPPSSPRNKASTSAGKRCRSPSEPTLKSSRLDEYFASQDISSQIPQKILCFLEERFDTILSKLEELSSKFDCLSNLHKEYDERLTHLEGEITELSTFRTVCMDNFSLQNYYIDSVYNDLKKNNIIVSGLSGNNKELVNNANGFIELFKRQNGESIPFINSYRILGTRLVLFELYTQADKRLIFKNLKKIQKLPSYSRIRVFDDLSYRSRLRHRKLLPFFAEAKSLNKKAFLKADCLTIDGDKFTFNLETNELQKINLFLDKSSQKD
ncbi:intraflagellar transport protein 46 homolog isoform X2 [Centruroides vittatus]|uniref:intraflagellar transport protein 46 homolog isoform X2 n=1 Tax=Centruroides vittatus TaxID=120091 RepID=UPI003510713A